ncbi:MAG: hypothetical protein F4X57_02580 [Chloroflexi bacterium]|nr:hypothetical protein [Chloroflexota bacterium]
MNELNKSLDNLKKCHKQTRNELAKIPESTIIEIYGESYSKKLHREMKRYGDGHSLYGIPMTVKELKGTDAVVLIGMSSPKLDSESDFNPFTPLHTIPHWRDDKRLKAQVHSTKSQKEYRLHFMSWQQECEIHGKNDNHARRNRRLLVNRRPVLESILQQERGASREFIKLLRNSSADSEIPWIVLTNSIKEHLDDAILNLLDDPDVIHIKAGLRSKNYKIMGLIGDKLP